MHLGEMLNEMILSVSGWRKIFAPDGEHGCGTALDKPHILLAVGMGVVWGQWLVNRLSQQPTVLVATDTRPTGPLLAEMVMCGLESLDCQVRYAGVAASPEVMARSGKDLNIDGFAYISASHNPLGYNGIKFGRGGGVIGGADAQELIKKYRQLIESMDAAERLSEIFDEFSDGNRVPRVATAREKTLCLAMYRTLLEEVAGGANQKETLNALRQGLQERPVCIIADLNGSARCTSVDRVYLESLGAGFRSMNAVAGVINHDILPEGDALEPCRAALEEAHAEDSAVLVGYVPDNDGDRGNLVVWDEACGAARPLEAQEVFALTALAELATGVWPANGLPSGKGAALVVNGPTSHRIREIAAVYGAKVYEAEVGEANVVNRAAELRAEGYQVRFLGEGSNGGSITHPAAVRDPLNTITALLKLLCLPARGDRVAPFEDWCRRIGKPHAYKKNFGPGNILAVLPQFTTTPASTPRARITINTRNHDLLKTAWEEIFRRQWSIEKKTLKEKFGFADWVGINNEGTISRVGMGPEVRTGQKSGGLKVVFRDEAGHYAGFLWMRGSGTEPVFRVMAEIRGNNQAKEQELVKWHRDMLLAADAMNSPNEYPAHRRISL